MIEDSSDNTLSKRRSTEIDYTFRVVLIGDSGVGKSTLLRRLIEGDGFDTNLFDEKTSSSTIVVDFKHKTFLLDHNSVKICLDFLTTGVFLQTMH